ncbi:FAD-binding protein [Sinimarinibacterium sp. CAU 1509]|uniref:D-arabinono-1,4-lactone oxidase n=1 Tax=Sinimarinibacterium sp. CAU 1509 TaxID=2562283 RepID=UPI0010AB7191|nr:D-arabinono-1,4-lactone oxidase [Sinimarinibacterium sp. CAU 1509]TJY60818.1 FAD-binding protein [Sinimarinibacterium sp. CAU 1509]
MNRREFLAATFSAALAGGLTACDDHGASEMPKAPVTSVGPDGKRRIPWQNWSGYQHCLPQSRTSPKSEDELAELLKTGAGPIRPVGAGHSFTPLVPTDGTIVSLRHFSGLLSHDAAAMTASFGAGTKLGQIGEVLDGVGQALQNMPDIDEQSIGGAIGTGTHGTGAELGALHSFITALRLVTPSGDVLDCSRTQHPEIFDAARVSMGSLGVITQVTFQNVPTHRLKRKVWLEPVDQLIERFDELAAANHSFEMYFLPNCDSGVAITINPTDEPLRPRTAEPDNDAVMQMKKLRDVLGWWPGARRWLLNRATADYQPEEAVDVWYRIFPSDRAVRFNEMEYHFDREHLLPTLKQVRQRVESKHSEVFFPIEVRVVRGDDAWLSPFSGHTHSGSIAVHRYFAEDPLPYFSDIEALYQPVEGRPHWGKMHTLGADVLSRRYPNWKQFQSVREALDPQGRMLNAHLKKVFGLV